MKQINLISFALNFTSFLVDRINIDKVILFGSVATNTFDNESDIDLFIETNKKNQDKIREILNLYKKTKEYEKFKLSGIKNEISIKCGNLKEWKGLEASIISEGIVLYGHYEGTPKSLKHKRLFLLNLEKIPRAKKIKVWRKLYGYRQKIGKKVYNSQGMIEKRIGRGAFLVSKENANNVISYLKENKIQYSFFDVWME